MPTTPDSSPRPRRSKTKMTEAALASRLAAHLDPKIVAAAAETSEPAPAPSPKRVAAEPAAPPEPPKAVLAKTAPPAQAASATLFGAGVSRLTGAVSDAQEMARDTARSLADTRLQAAHSIVAFQKKLLEMVHSNLNEGFQVAQKIVTAPNVGAAIKAQSSFATGQVKTLTNQAAELRSLSAKLAAATQEPWTAHLAKSLERIKSGLHA